MSVILWGENVAIRYSDILNTVDLNFNHFVEIRRQLHQYPELGLQEFLTAEKIEEVCRNWGILTGPRINKTSIVGIIKGNGKAGKNVGLRADMDALPIQEQKDVPYKSKRDGVMHACGHDVHMAIQLGAAFVLNGLKDHIPGDVKLLFQQAEETVGGAKTMIESGVLENPDVNYVLGMHVDPHIEVGQFGVKYRYAYASSDTIIIYVHGHSAHGAYPHEGVDAILIASNIVTALQTLVSRNTPPLDSAVLSFGRIEGGDAHNIIASHVKLTGTLRTLNKDIRNLLKSRIFEVATNIAKAYGGDVSLRVESGYDALYNDEYVTQIVENVASRVLGSDAVHVLENPSLGVEDFAYFAKEVPSSYNRLGVANKKKGITTPVHDPGFNVDEECIRNGVLIQVLSVLALMGVEVRG